VLFFDLELLLIMKGNCVQTLVDKGAEKILSGLLAKTGVEVSSSELADIIVRDRSFCREVLLTGSMGLGDSYIKGKWDSDNLDEVIYKIVKSGLHQLLAPIYDFVGIQRRKMRNLQDKEGSKKVMDEHYDLPVEIYEAFLDPYFQYTCARFEGTDNLDEAQKIKMENICDKLDLKEGDRVLDIGGGWGGLAKYMSETRNINVTVVTLSKEQAEYIRKQHDGNTEVVESDYRDIPDALNEKFDAISVVGMMEHVGSKNYEEFMNVLHDKLKTGGKLLIHTLYTPYSEPMQNPWLDKHIFPNGELAPKEVIEDEMSKYFVPNNESDYPIFEELTPNYPPTLISWRNNLKEARQRGEITMDDKEFRKWEFYFMSFAGMMRANHVRVGQFSYKKAA